LGGGDLVVRAAAFMPGLAGRRETCGAVIGGLMALAGWGSVLLGGCPLRQLILAGEGNGDSAVTVLGMVVGAALAHNFGLAGNADSVAEDGTYVVGGIGTAGMVAVVLGFIVLLAVTLTHLPGKEDA
jgi:uncharacterized membrane protein YedE/YeeE